MKKTNIIVVITLLLSIVVSNLNAQNLYLRLGGGYAFPLGGLAGGSQSFNGATITFYNVSTYSFSSSSSNNYTTRDAMISNFGKGLNFMLNAGYKINENIAVELGLGYFSSAKYTATSSSYRDGALTGESIPEITNNYLKVNPCLVIMTNDATIQPYARFGILFGLSPKGTFKYNGKSLNSITKVWSTESMKGEFTGSTPIGFNAAIGTNIKLTEKMQLFVECEIIGMSWSYTKLVLTSVIDNGVEYISNMDINEKEFEFVESISTKDPTGSTIPTKRLKDLFPMHSIGINVGIKIGL